MALDYRITTVVTPATSNWLVTLDAALDELGLTSDGGTQDSQVGRIIGQVSAAISAYCGRIFVKQSYRDQFRYPCNWLGYGKPLLLSRAPIAVDGDGAAILTATEDGAAVVLAEWEADLSAGMLYRLDSGGSATSWTGSLVVVDYDAGYDLIPEDVQAAALRWLVMRYTARGRDPLLRSEEVPGAQRFDYQVSQAPAGVPPDVAEMLGPYRVWSV
jgi:hypothetical protein